MLILRKKKKKRRVRHKHKLNLKTRLESAREYVGNPKIENPRPKSFFFVSIPIWPDTYLKKKKKSVRHKHKLSLKTRLESAREYAGNPKTENPRRKSFSLVATPIWDNLFLAMVSDQNLKKQKIWFYIQKFWFSIFWFVR